MQEIEKALTPGQKNDLTICQSQIDKAFTETTKLLLGTELKNIDDYSSWLGKYIPLPYNSKSHLSGKEVWLPPPLVYLRKHFNTSRVIDFSEMEKPVSPFSPDEIANASLDDLKKRLIAPVAFYCGNFRCWTSENFDKVSGGGAGRNVYYSEDVYLDVKNVAFSNYALYCINVFGSHNITYSQFCIHAYNCTSIARCFEVEGCTNSRDLFFCHNCENVQDSMFCFNAKNLKNAIANVPLPPVKYAELKKLILGEIVGELQQKKHLKYDIFNLGDKNV